MTRYRPQIRADLLTEYGIDLAVWWRQRRWAGLLELIDELPSASRFNEAILNDREFAEAVVAQETGEAPEWAPKISEFDLHALLLRDVIQSLQGVQAAVIAGAGGKPPKVAAYPAPRTALDDARERLLSEWADDLISKLTPHAAR